MSNLLKKEGVGGVGIYVEQRRGIIQDASLQLMSEARKLANKLKTKVVAMMVGYNIGSIVPEPVYYGADKVAYVDDKLFTSHHPRIYTDALTSLLEKYKPEIFLVAGTKYGRELAPSIAARLKTGITADCTGFDVDDDGNLLQIRPTLGGRILACIITPDQRPQIATVRPNIFPTTKRDGSRKGEIIREEIVVHPQKLKLIKFEERRDVELPVEKAEVIVSWGRGFNKEDLTLLQELSSLFPKCSVGCSRPIVDAGLMPRTRQVGQTGKSVSPKMYIAVGISGAVQHLAGMKDSEYVLAINKDPNAEIFKHSDFGIVGDYREIIPMLVAKLSQRPAKG